jgi:Flp pilus assembly protein TadG
VPNKLEDVNKGPRAGTRMKTHRGPIRIAKTSSRHGAAAVECAIIAPLLTLLVLGAIDVGQFVNVYQKVSDASREAARIAARNGTATTSQVEAAVIDYLEKVSPGVSPATLDSATDVVVTGSAGNAPAGGSLKSIPAGSEVRVRVTLQYDPVRWIGGISGLDGSQISAMTVMRRE